MDRMDRFSSGRANNRNVPIGEPSGIVRRPSAPIS